MSMSNSSSNNSMNKPNSLAMGVRCNIDETVAVATTATVNTTNGNCDATSTFQQCGIVTTNIHRLNHDDDDHDDGTDIKIFQSSTRITSTLLACTIQREVDVVRYRLLCLAAMKSIRRKKLQQQQQIDMKATTKNDSSSNNRGKRSFESMIQNSNYYTSIEMIERVSLTQRAKRIKKLSILLHQMETIQNEIYLELNNSSYMSM